MSEAERIAEKTYPPNEARAYLDGYNAALRAQEQNEPLTECEFCLGCATEHGFYISKGALFYLDSQLGAEGIEIRYCPICGRNLNLCESEHAPLEGADK